MFQQQQLGITMKDSKTLEYFMQKAGIGYSQLLFMEIPCEKCGKPYIYMDFVKSKGKERVRTLCADHFKEWSERKK